MVNSTEVGHIEVDDTRKVVASNPLSEENCQWRWTATGLRGSVEVHTTQENVCACQENWWKNSTKVFFSRSNSQAWGTPEVSNATLRSRTAGVFFLDRAERLQRDLTMYWPPSGSCWQRSSASNPRKFSEKVSTVSSFPTQKDVGRYRPLPRSWQNSWGVATETTLAAILSNVQACIVQDSCACVGRLLKSSPCWKRSFSFSFQLCPATGWTILSMVSLKMVFRTQFRDCYNIYLQ